MNRFLRRAAGSQAEESSTEAHPSVAAGGQDGRRSRQALVDYFRILQEWSLKARPEGFVGDQRMASGTAPKVRKCG